MLFVLCTEGLHWLAGVRLLVSGELLVADYLVILLKSCDFQTGTTSCINIIF